MFEKSGIKPMKGKGGPGGGMRELEEKFVGLSKSSAAVKLNDEKKQRLEEITAQVKELKKDMKPGHAPGGPGQGGKLGIGGKPSDGKHGKPPEMNDEMKAKMEEDKEKFTKIEALIEEGIKLFD